jgi:hypothetical protein
MIGLAYAPSQSIKFDMCCLFQKNYCIKSGNQPQANLANFGSMTNREVENLEILLCWLTTKTY